ncbi:MAG: GNAT family N-acetyltransferase [Bacteroidetes bacterium]|nr:GNAT family N-acetyltransferase [Bacteroidota bacterium]
MSRVEIKKVGPDELIDLQIISSQTFIETFSGDNSPEDMAAYVTGHFSMERLAAELDNPLSAFYFAEMEQNILGYLKINKPHAQTPPLENTWIEIERLYVLAQYQGKRLGKLLLETAEQVGMAFSSEYLWLGVWEKNSRAIAFYTKHGFKSFDSHIFTLGSDQQRDILMKKKIV